MPHRSGLPALYETGKRANRGEWLDLPYAFDQVIQAANTILGRYKPEGKVVIPKRPIWPREAMSDLSNKDAKELERKMLQRLGLFNALEELKKEKKT